MCAGSTSACGCGPWPTSHTMPAMRSRARRPCQKPDMSDAASHIDAELAEARTRLAELEQREHEHLESERVQALLYRIAETASAAQDMQEFYAAIHSIVSELMYAENFYI